MFEHDHSAARGKMCMRKLIIFRHESKLGNAPSAKLFEKITVRRKPDISVPRSYGDYIINIDGNMPDGVQLIERF